MRARADGTSASWRSHLGFLRSLVIYRCRPWKQTALERFYTSLLTPDMLAFDIGAHIGHRTDAMLAAGATCVALEPQPLFSSYLERRFSETDRVAVVASAVGRSSGFANLSISSLHPTVSSLSSSWVDKVRGSSGFTHVRWNENLRVPVTTLDSLIQIHGIPDFCKIDVEGMEAEILGGLSTPVSLVAFEYVPATLELAFDCMDRLDSLGDYRYDFSVGESHQLVVPGRHKPAAARQSLTALASDGQSGDVYAWWQSPESSRSEVRASA